MPIWRMAPWAISTSQRSRTTKNRSSHKQTFLPPSLTRKIIKMHSMTYTWSCPRATGWTFSNGRSLTVQDNKIGRMPLTTSRQRDRSRTRHCWRSHYSREAPLFSQKGGRPEQRAGSVKFGFPSRLSFSSASQTQKGLLAHLSWSQTQLIFLSSPYLPTA